MNGSPVSCSVSSIAHRIDRVAFPAIHFPVDLGQFFPDHLFKLRIDVFLDFLQAILGIADRLVQMFLDFLLQGLLARRHMLAQNFQLFAKLGNDLEIILGALNPCLEIF